jgi:hypothetical protein
MKLTSSSAEAKSEWSYNSTPPHTYMALERRQLYFFKFVKQEKELTSWQSRSDL